MNEVETSCLTISSLFDEYVDSKEKIDKSIKTLNNENQNLKERISQINHNYDRLNDELLELKTRSMQENLLFFGIQETDGRNESSEDILRSFLKTTVLQNSIEYID